MKKLYLFLILAVVYSFLAIAMNNRISKERLEGKWNVKVADAPSGYQDYVLEIKEDKFDVHFLNSNRRISDIPLASEDGKLNGTVNIDGERINVTIWEERGVILGTAQNSWIGTLRMTFTRPKD